MSAFGAAVFLALAVIIVRSLLARRRPGASEIDDSSDE
jgi:hypothetical protein